MSQTVLIAQGGVAIASTGNDPNTIPMRDASGNIDGLAVTGVSVADQSGTTNATWTVDSSSGAAKIKIDTNSATGNFTAKWVTPNLAGNVTITHPAVTSTLATLAGTESLSAKTLVAPVVSTGCTASGSASNDFSGSTGTFKTSTGLVTVGGKCAFKVIATPVAATGSDVSGAAALGSGTILTVSSDSAAKGWKLLTGVAGDIVEIIATTATAGILYPATGGTINGLSANAGVLIPASKGVLLFCTAADTWIAYDMPAKSTAA